MALSYVTHAGDGATTKFSVSFPYLAQADVLVYLDGVLQVLTTDYTWFNSSTIEFNTAPTGGAVIKFLRSTTNTARLVDYQDAGNLTESDLDTDSNQLFYLVQEGLDNFNDNAMALDTDDKWQANSKVIKNVTDPTNAQDAATKAYGEANWGGAAAAAAAASAAAAATSETNAATSETNADTSATAAASSASAAATSYDNFDDRYLGAKASDPTLDNDGDPLVTGALYFNTTVGAMKVYDGSSWKAVGSSTVLYYSYVATASQTSFSGADDNSNVFAYVSNAVLGVYQNGVRLREGAGHDYTLSSGTTLTLNTGAALNDLIEIAVVDTFVVADAISQTTADARYLKKTDDLADIYTPTKGNLLVGNGTEFVEVGVGSNDQRLVADSTQAAGVKWATETQHVTELTAQNFFSSTAQKKTFAHGLGAKPRGVEVTVRCLTAELGYAIGDEIMVPQRMDTNSGAWVGFAYWFDATNVYVMSGANANYNQFFNATNGNVTTATNANWQLVVRVYY